MTSEADEILAPLGARILWVTPAARTAATLVLRERPTMPLIAGCRRGLHDHRLAYAVPDRGRIVLWTEQVTRAARGDWDSGKARPLGERELGRALGRVLAHELGHLFLGKSQHEASGLMRSSFRHRDLTGRRRESMSFTTHDRQVLEAHRARVARYLESVASSGQSEGIPARVARPRRPN